MTIALFPLINGTNDKRDILRIKNVYYTCYI